MFKKIVEITNFFSRVELADTGIMIDEDVSLGVSVGDCAAVMRQGFTERVGIWCAVKISNDFSYIWTVTV